MTKHLQNFLRARGGESLLVDPHLMEHIVHDHERRPNEPTQKRRRSVFPKSQGLIQEQPQIKIFSLKVLEQIHFLEVAKFVLPSSLIWTLNKKS